MPYTVACPVCGIDGTPAANNFIAAQVAPAPAILVQAPPAPPPSAPAPRGGTRPAQEIDIMQITHEARARSLWGDEQPEVMKFLMLKGVPHAEAKKLSEALFAERVAAVRKNGVTKTVIGLAMMCVPVVTFLSFRAAGFMPIKLLGIAGAVGLWGAYKVLRGTLMFFAPKSEAGDVSEQ
jgi:hypothetical protein